ncbi:hypothetical protein [Aquimarina sp. ERC-38]|nr:hypothetical protein [Aquimarina sp. ERC-38]
MFHKFLGFVKMNANVQATMAYFHGARYENLSGEKTRYPINA